MQFFHVALIVASLVCANAFSTSNIRSRSGVVILKAAEQDVKDLNLEQMFDVFEKADKLPGGQMKSTGSGSAGGKSLSVPFLPKPKNLQGMIGNKDFDPIGISDFIDARFLREAELKHGRVCMLATLGWIVTIFHNPVLGVGPLEAHNAGVASGANAQVLTAIAALEFIGVIALQQTMSGKGRAPGDFGFDPLGMSAKLDAKGKATMALKELENGRLAMCAFAGLVTVSAAFPDQAFPYF